MKVLLALVLDAFEAHGAEMAHRGSRVLVLGVGAWDFLELTPAPKLPPRYLHLRPKD